VLDFAGYAADCRVFGHIDPGDRRLSDVLNATAQLRIVNARLEALADGHVVELPDITIERDELYAVVASGPRGDVTRRLRTITTRVTADVGAYHVEGDVHGTPASDPLSAALRRAAWIPLTSVTITYSLAGSEIQDALPTLLVNRTLARSLVAHEEEHRALPWEAAADAGRLTPATRRAIDLTGSE
jgi:hypothetical protein